MKRYTLLGSASATVHTPKSTPEKSLEMAMSKCMKESGDESTSRKIKIKRQNVNRILLVPDDILLEILKRVPDAFLRYRVKYVCRRWFKIITNRILLDHESYILHNPSRRVRLVDIWEDRQGLQVKEQSLDIVPPGRIQCWCNEFLLMTCPFGVRTMCVFNPITKEALYLPKCTATSCGGHKYCKCGLALYYDRFKGIYKVVHLFIGPSSGCEILVLGDSRASLEWKRIQVPYTSQGNHMWADPVEVQGRYLHWKIRESNTLVCVDMVEEVVCKMRLPVSRDRVENVVSFFEMDGILAFFDGVTRDKAQIWVRKDFYRKKWKKLRSITVDNSYFEKYPHKIKFFKFCGMISKRYAIMDSTMENGMYSYDLKDGVMKRLDIDIEPSRVRRVVRSSAPRFLKSKPKTTNRKSNKMKEEGGIA